VTSIVSFADLKAYLNLSKDTIDDYPALAVNVDLVHAALEDYCGRYIGEEEINVEESYHEFDSTKIVNLKHLPITAINSFKVNDVEIDIGSYTVGKYGLVTRFDISDAHVYIDYDGGYEDIPTALYRAELIQIAYEYQTNDHIGATDVSTDGGSVSTPAIGLLSTVKQLLNPYIHPSRLN